jgi:hypothetical protein
MPGWPWRAGALAAVPMLAAVLAGCSSARSSAAPPPDSPGPGVFRIYAGTGQSIPMWYSAETLPDGTKVSIGIGPRSVHLANGKLSAAFSLRYPGEPSSQLTNGFWLSPGQSEMVGGRYRFAVLGIWDMPSPATDVADVRITSIG